MSTPLQPRKESAGDYLSARTTQKEKIATPSSVWGMLFFPAAAPLPPLVSPRICDYMAATDPSNCAMMSGRSRL